MFEQGAFETLARCVPGLVAAGGAFDPIRAVGDDASIAGAGSDGRPTDDGAISFDIEWTSPSGTPVLRTLLITTADGSLVLMDERFTVDD